MSKYRGEIEKQGDKYFIYFKYNPVLVNKVKDITGRRWNGDQKCWMVPISSELEILAFASENHFEFVGEKPVEQDFIMPEMPELTFEIPLKRTLFSYQKTGVAYCMEKERVIVGDQMGTGKMEFVENMVFTPTGRKRIGDLKLNDKVIGSDGLGHRVTGVFPKGIKDLYRVTFNDGYSILVGEEHLWSVSTRNYGINSNNNQVKEDIVLSTGQMMGHGAILRNGHGRNKNKEYVFELHYKESNGNLKWQIPIVKTIKFQRNDFLLIEPYLLGLCLGDGYIKKTAVAFTIHKDDYDEMFPNTPFTQYDYRPNIRKCNIYFGNLLHYLNLQNTRSDNKFIPNEYKYSSIENRISILQGLMDTDGHCMISRKNKDTFSGTEFCSVSERLVDDVAEIVQSLGGICRKRSKIGTYTKDGIKVICKKVFRLNIKMPEGINPFRLKRKAIAYNHPQKYKIGRYIKDIRFEKQGEAVCISVDSPDKLYVTEHGIVTHNTTQVIAAIEGLKVLNREPGPTLIICPASLKINWQREIHTVTGKRSIIISSQNAAHIPHLISRADIEYFIVNYESLKKYFVTEIKESKKFTLKDVVFNFKKDLFKSVIIDESHRIKSTQTLQFKLSFGICKGKRFIYLLTGTPVVNKPVDLFSQLSAIFQIQQFGGYNGFMNRYCAGKKQASNLKELQFILKTNCFYRREKTDVMKDLPPKTRQNIICELDREHRIEYEDAERDLIEYLKTYKQQTDESIARSMRGEVMVRIGILKNISARGKLKDCCDFIQNMVDSGEKLIVFAHLKEVFAKILHKFPDAVTITGDDSMDQRQANIDKFQNDPEQMLIFCSIRAAGVGITLTAASNVSFIEQDWTAASMEQCEDRAHRIGQVDSVNCYYFLGKDTIDNRIYDIINTKRVISNEVTGGVNDVEESVIENIMDLYLGKDKYKTEDEDFGTIVDEVTENKLFSPFE